MKGHASAGLVLFLLASPALAQDIAYTGTVFATHGTYLDGAEKSSSLFVFNTVEAGAGRFHASVSVPFISRRTTWTPTGAEVAAGTADTAFKDTATGVGDPWVRAEVRVVDDRLRGVQVSVAGSLKLPMVSAENGLGTGKADAALGGSMYVTQGAASFFVDAMFWKYGDPEGIDFQDALSYGLGVGHVIGSGRWSAAGSLVGFSRGIDGTSPPLQLTLTVLRLLSARQSLALSAGFGLNDRTDRISIGASWRVAR